MVGDELLRRLLVRRIPRSHLHPAGVEPLADGPPDPPHSAGDQRHLTSHVSHDEPSLQLATRMIRASPCPPPPHSPAAPTPPPRRCNSRTRCSASRAPEAPTGCPIEMAPPLTLTE